MDAHEARQVAEKAKITKDKTYIDLKNMIKDKANAGLFDLRVNTQFLTTSLANQLQIEGFKISYIGSTCTISW